MKRYIILFLCTIILPTYLSITAQNTNRRMNLQEYENRKKEYVQKEAGLTQTEANKYFPLSNELTQKKFNLRKLHRDKVQRIKDNSNISDAEYRKLLDDDLEVRQQESALDKEYADKFEKVLSPEKLFKAQQAERDFIQKEVTNFRSGQRGNQGRR